MEARRLLYSAMVMAPVVLMGGIGVHARTYDDPFEWTQTASDQRRINAYLPLAIETKKLLDYSMDCPASQTKQMARKWIASEERGKLKPLAPIAVEELLPSGAKARVFDISLALTRKLTTDADAEMDHGDYKAATESLVLASRTSGIIKYSNFVTVYRCTLLQAHACERIARAFPNVDPENQKRLVVAAKLLRQHRGKLAILADQARKLVVQSVRQHEDIETAISTADQVVPSRSYFEQPAEAKEKTGYGVDLIGDRYTIPNQFASVERCMFADEQLKLKIRKILSFNQKPKATN